MRTALICLVVVSTLFLVGCSGRSAGSSPGAEWRQWKDIATAASPLIPLPDHAFVDIALSERPWEYWEEVLRLCKNDGHHCVLDEFRERYEAAEVRCACCEIDVARQSSGVKEGGGCTVEECGNCLEVIWMRKQGRDATRQVEAKVSRKPVKAESKNE